MEREKLKRDLVREAITRMEDAARTVEDFQKVIKAWNHLDENRERRERDHEVGRSEIPLEWGAKEDGLVFPRPIAHVYWRQILRGEFLDAIFDCLYELHELVEDEDISNL